MDEKNMNYIDIEALITDPGFQELKFQQEKTNVFTIVGQTHTEHWHSSFFRWLLDPHSSMRLGHFPLARLLTLYMIKVPDCGYTLRDIYNWHLDDITFVTEKNASMDGKKRSIDVYGESGELILVIENKVNARENFNKTEQGQTMDYYKYVESIRKPDQRALYFFFSADARQEPYADMYARFSYQELFDGIIDKCIRHPQVSDDGRYMLEQYAANLRETVHGSNTPMALVHGDLCREIYDRHPELINAVFSAVDGAAELCTSSDPLCMVYEHYQNIFDEIFLSVDEHFGRTPHSRLQRQVVTFTELYHHGLVRDNMKFTMKYDGEIYQARAVVNPDDNNCYIQVLDQNGQPYTDPETHEMMGIYSSSSAAGIEVINLRRQQRGEAKMIQTLRGTVYWVNEDGQTIKDLIDKL